MRTKRLLLATTVVTSVFVFNSASIAVTPTRYESLDKTTFTRIIPENTLKGPVIAKIAEIEPIYDKFDKKRSFTRITPQKEAKVHVIRKNDPPKAVISHSSGRKVTGLATWYCKAGVSSCHYKYPDRSGAQMYAAAGGEIRIGHWRNRVVKVCAGKTCIHVKLVDWCACKGNRIIDLYSDAFRKLAPLGRGYTKVKVSW